MNKLTLSLFLTFFCISIFAQSTFPVIKANSTTASLRDGIVYCKDCWTISPSTNPDVWEIQISKKKKKTISFITDIDSITFKVALDKTYNFIVLLNDKDSAFTQIKTSEKIDVLKNKSPYLLTHRLIYDNNFKWLVKSDGRYKYFYEKDSWADKNINYIIAKQDSAIQMTLKLIHKKYFKDSIYSFFFDSKAKVILWRGDSLAPNAGCQGLYTFYTCTDKWISFSNHELCHLVSINKLGKTKVSISEGIAVFADNDWNGLPLELISKNILEKESGNDSLTFKKVYESFETIDPDDAYPLAGSIFKYLYKTYSIHKIKKIWKTPDDIERITGKNFIQLDYEWKQFIKKYR